MQTSNADKVSTIDQSAESEDVKKALESNPDISKERDNLLHGVSVCLSITWCVCLSITRCVCLSVHHMVCLSVCPSHGVSVCLSITWCVCLSITRCVCLSVHHMVCLSVHHHCDLLHGVCVCLSVCLSVIIATFIPPPSLRLVKYVPVPPD